MPFNPRPIDKIEQRAGDILHAIEAIRTYVRGVTREAFLSERMRQDAVARQFLIIAEACDKIAALEARLGIPAEKTLAARQPGVPWRLIRDMGIRIRHMYADEDATILWSTAVEADLTELKAALQTEFPPQA